ncbi:MAG TPA: replication-associated recombination protein A [Candidatus Stercoripulliclostridium merdipullorum]|uniref:Replication-associated recombination protein A n=1 Tax=Candidatus Stercoripulliclostridium merdipullorum TaxID=2840952 RepID=A0A9D1SXW1_9FIRM|nr:replication-associated recombination protein A [Candidatus Stercoripulliclostridium merdipullorum]
MDLFDSVREQHAPLAERMRCTRLEDFIGQEHLIHPDSLLSRAIRADRLGSCIFYGPPGTGKTTLANIIANTTGAAYAYLNAVSSGVADAKKVIEEAKNRLALYGTKTYLLLDECHRWNKAQSDCVLGAIEKGEIVFIGSTTENPYVSMTKAILSRCRIFEFRPLSAANIREGLMRALKDPEKGLGNYNVNLSEEAIGHFVFVSGGDLRTALNALELAVLTTPPAADGSITVDLSVAEQSVQRKAMSVDESLYYDIISAFCKSLRGSDPDAALYYAMRLINAGCDPMLILRRLIVHSAEDVGLADPNALNVAVNAMLAFERLGLPEGRIPMTEAIIYVCLAPKSNSVVNALYAADAASRKAEDESIPTYLKDVNYKSERIEGYKYPHDYGGWVEQQYLPDAIKDDRYYFPGENGAERGRYLPKIEKKKPQ